MATTYTLTGDFGDLIDSDIASKPGFRAWVTTNLPPGRALADKTGNKILLGDHRLDVNTADGTFTAAGLPATDSTDLNVPAGELRYKVFARYSNAVGRPETFDSGWFELTADANLADVVEAEAIDPSYATAVMDQVAADAARAEAAADLAVAPTDTQVASLVGTPASETATALSTTFAPRLATLAPAKFTTPATMSSAPTVGALATATAIPSAKKWSSTTDSTSGSVVANRFSYPGAAKPIVYSTAYPNYLYTAFKHRTSSNEATAPYKAEFVFDGTTLEVLFKGMAGFVRVRVDGEYVAETPQLIGNTGSIYFLPITFASRANRIITVEGQGIPWGGVMTGPLDSITPAPIKRPRVVLVGDSYTEGSVDGNTNAIQAWGRLFGDLMGWPDVFNSGVGGTGYLNPGASPRVKFRDRIQNDVLDLAPDMVIVAGGHNDTTAKNAAYTLAALEAEVNAYFTALRAGLPNAVLIAVGPFYPGSLAASYGVVQTAIFAGAAGLADFTIDTVTAPPFTGTGRVGATAGNGNSDLYIHTDATHPTLAGQNWLARFMAGRVSAALSA